MPKLVFTAVRRVSALGFPFRQKESQQAVMISEMSSDCNTAKGIGVGFPLLKGAS